MSDEGEHSDALCHPDMVDTRVRKRNYTNEEVEILVKEVARFKDFLLTHKFINQSNDKKEKIWRYITQCVNNHSKHLPRTVNEVKKKWSDLCFNTKKLQEKNSLKTKIRRSDLSQLEKDVMALVNLRNESNSVESITSNGSRLDCTLDVSRDALDVDLNGVVDVPSDDSNVAEEQNMVFIERIGDSTESLAVSRYSKMKSDKTEHPTNKMMKLRNSKKAVTKKQTSSSKSRMKMRRQSKARLADEIVDEQNADSETEIEDYFDSESKTAKSASDVEGEVNCTSEKGDSEMLRVEKERLDVEKRRLHVEEERLEVEKKRLKLEIYRWEVEKARFNRKAAAEKNQEKNGDNRGGHCDKYILQYGERNSPITSPSNNDVLLNSHSSIRNNAESERIYMNQDIRQNHTSLLTYDSR